MGLPTLAAIKAKIPAHCFVPSLPWSLFYVARSIFIAAVLVKLLLADLPFPPLLDYYLYVVLQGLVFWGIFTLGHDCGHGAFSRYHLINWIVGNALHAFLLVPYEPWRLSHRSHHQHTGNADRDEIFYPHPPRHHVALTRYGVGLAWFVYLLISNAPGRRNYTAYVRDAGKFRRHYPALCVSFASVGAMLWFLWCAIQAYGLFTVTILYFAPLAVFACDLVIVTFLHHHDYEKIKWYSDAEWKHVAGRLASVDRDFGWITNTLSHHINLHQVHHLFPTIPHYHLRDATGAFRAAFPELVVRREYQNMFYDFASEVKHWAS